MTSDAPHSSHYRGDVEPIDLIEAMGAGEAFCAANVIKYVARYRNKDGVTDLEKAQWYLERLIDLEKRRAARTLASQQVIEKAKANVSNQQ